MYQARLDPNYQRHELGRSLVESVLGVGTFFVNAVRSALHREKFSGCCLGFGPIVVFPHQASTVVMDVVEATFDAPSKRSSRGTKKASKPHDAMRIETETSKGSQRQIYEGKEHVIVPMVPQLPFKPRKIVFDTDVSGLYIHDLKFGKNSILLSSNPVPASALHEQEFEWPTINVGQQILLSVANFGDKEIVLGGMLVGEAAQ